MLDSKDFLEVTAPTSIWRTCSPWNLNSSLSLLELYIDFQVHQRIMHSRDGLCMDLLFSLVVHRLITRKL